MNKIYFNILLKVLLSITIFIVSTFLNAQEITTHSIPQLSQFPSPAIYRVFCDSQGYMWFGTINGLTRLDGYNIKVYRSDFLHPRPMEDNYVQFINEAGDGKIWFSTNQGCYILDKTTDKVTKLDLGKFSNLRAFHISPSTDGSMWISFVGVLLRLNLKGEVIKNYPIAPDAALYFVYETQKKETILSLSKQGMFKWNQKKDILEPYHFNKDINDVERIEWDDIHKCYWLGTWGKGIVKFNPELSKDKQYVLQTLPKDDEGNDDRTLFHMVMDNIYHWIWITTNKGLYAFKVDNSGKLRQIDLNKLMDRPNHIMYEICEDKKGHLWVSVQDAESFIIDIKKSENTSKTFSRKKTEELVSEKLYTIDKGNPFVTNLAIGNDGYMWITQERHGLSLYDTHTGDIQNYMEIPSVGTKLTYEEILTLSENGNNVWFGEPWAKFVCQLGHEGTTIKTLSYYFLPDIGVDGELTTIHEDLQGTLWIGTINSLYYLEPKTKKAHKIEGIAGYISSLCCTSDGNIWTAVKGIGLYKISKVGKKTSFQKYEIKKNFTKIAPSSEGNIWFGTDEGELMCFNGKTKAVEDFTHKCNMNGDAIINVLIDNYNHVWATTSKVIKEINPANGAYRIYMNNISKSIPKRIAKHSAVTDTDGNIYIGEAGGIQIFQPSHQLESIPEDIKILITDLKIKGESMAFDGKSIEIPANAEDIEIDFSTLSYINTEQIRFAYRIKGVNKDWVYLKEGNNKAIYNKLDKGTYEFEVMATDENGLWTDNITTFTITRLPYWYETWYAYVLYILIGIALFVFAIRKYNKYIQQKNDELLQDSEELIKMRSYLQSTIKVEDEEYVQLDQMLLDKATEIVKQHISDEDFDVIKFADEMHTSRSTLRRKILAITGKTPLKFIKDIKMQYASQLLSKGATIQETIMAIGYKDYKNFVSNFKETYNKTPMEWIKEDVPNHEG